MYKLFVVEDDPGIAESVKSLAESWGFCVHCVEDFFNVTAEFAKFDPHIVLLDISLPFYNGYYICGEIRKFSKVPIVFLSSASDNMNMIMAMNMGADDFIPKPFDGNLLMAKIGALLRRTYDFSSQISVIEHRGVILNTDDGSVIFNGEKILLSKNEYRILYVLMTNRGRVVSRENLIEKLWQTDSFIDDNTLSVNVNRLRHRLEEAGVCDFIKTKFGQGYIIED